MLVGAVDEGVNGEEGCNKTDANRDEEGRLLEQGRRDFEGKVLKGFCFGAELVFGLEVNGVSAVGEVRDGDGARREPIGPGAAVEAKACEMAITGAGFAKAEDTPIENGCGAVDLWWEDNEPGDRAVEGFTAEAL